MKSLNKILKENLNKKLFDFIRKKLDNVYHYKDGSNPKFIKKPNESTDYPLIYFIMNKDEYWDLILDMEEYIADRYGIDGDYVVEYISDYVDTKLPNEVLDKLFGDEDIIDEAEGSESGGSKDTSSTTTQWQSGITRGSANPITNDSQWTGQRGWEGIKAYNVKRGKANPLA